MDASKRIILSEERLAGRFLKIFAGVFAAIAVFIFLSDFKMVGIALFFLAPAVGIYFIGVHQEKKYKTLGRTPLALDSTACIVGTATSGKVTVNRKDFNKVNQLTLSCTRRQSGENSYSDVIWSTTIEPTITPQGDVTIIEFSLLIPKGKPETTSTFFSRNTYYYELKFSYTELMESIERTWKIPVKAA